MEKKKEKVALFHPWIKCKGGAERVLLEMLKSSKYDFDIYTWIYDKDNTFPEFKNYKINVIAPKWAARFSRSFFTRGLLPLLTKDFPINNYNILLISTSGVAELLLLRYRTRNNILYCHTPLRAADKDIQKWNKKHLFPSSLKKGLYDVAIKIYNFFERKSWEKADLVIFNSNLSYFRAQGKDLPIKEAEVILPPLDLDRFKPIRNPSNNFFLYVSRFNPPKRQDSLIRIWKQFQARHPKERLILAGSIENKMFLDKVKKMSSGLNIEFRTDISDEEMLKLYQNCKAFLFPAYEEDFGIAPLEAAALGKPIIGCYGGYTTLLRSNPNYFEVSPEWHYGKKRGLYFEEAFLKTLEGFIKHKVIKYHQVVKNNFIRELERKLDERGNKNKNHNNA